MADPNLSEPKAAESSETVLSVISGVVESVATGVPAPIRKNVFKALDRLMTDAVDIPVARLEGRAAEARAESEARVMLISQVNKQIAAKLSVDPYFSDAASVKHAEKIVRERINQQKVATETLEALKLASPAEATDTVADISEDWLNVFEEHAGRMSTQQMQQLFGRILAGEIRKPATFSIKTLNLMAQLDNQAAALFTRLCSLATVLQFDTHVMDARVISNGDPGANSLIGFGLGFDNLNILAEYGLIISDYNSRLDYRGIVAIGAASSTPLFYQKMMHALVPIGEPFLPDQQVPTVGVAFSKAGKELYKIVDLDPIDAAYSKYLTEYFAQRRLSFVTLPSAGL